MDIPDGSGRKDFVRFDHFSVKEYLSAIPSTSSGTAYYFVPPEIAHLAIAQVCVSRWQETNDDEVTSGKLLDIPLIRYSALRYRHIQAADQFAAKSSTFPPEKRQIDDKSLAQIESLRSDAHRFWCKENTLSFLNWLRCLDASDNRELLYSNWSARDDLTASRGGEAYLLCWAAWPHRQRAEAH